MKNIKRTISVLIAMAILGTTTAFADTQGLPLSLEVAATNEIATYCWEAYFPGEGFASWTWVDNTLDLLQPGNREGNPVSPSGGDPRDSWNIGTFIQTYYDTLGAAPNDKSSAADNNAFAYGDCFVGVTTNNQSGWTIDFVGDSGGFEDFYANDIADMQGYNTAGFDYTLENEDPSTPYPGTNEELGFFIAAASDGTNSYYNEMFPYHSGCGLEEICDPPWGQLDTGSAFNGGVDLYSTERPYTDATCGSLSDRPCYHAIPDDTVDFSGHTLYAGSAGETVDNGAFVLRFGLGVDFGTRPTDFLDTYTQTMTITLTPLP